MTDQIPAEAVEAAAKAWPRAYQDAVIRAPKGKHGISAEEARKCVMEAMTAALSAALPFLRPEPSEDEREALDRLIVEHDPDGRHPDDQRRCPCGELIGESDGLVVTTDPYGHLRDVILATGFTRRPMPSREQVARVIYDCDDLERAVLADAESIADAVLALFKGGEG